MIYIHIYVYVYVYVYVHICVYIAQPTLSVTFGYRGVFSNVPAIVVAYW